LSNARAYDPNEHLERLAAIALAIEAPLLAHSARQWATRVAEGLFYVACVGQFKRGKSTLLNALVEREVLPTGVAPVTSVVTVLRYGDRVRARVRFLDDRLADVEPLELAAYVSEVGNPENDKSVSGVELFVPSPLLASGMCLVDTPGLGSVFLASDETTRAFVPHVDAAVVVLGSDPPISAEEVALVRELSAHVRDFVFVLNKSDRLSDEDREAGRSFSAHVLSDALGRPAGPLFEISAIEHLRGTGSGRDWDALRQALVLLAQGSGAALARGAAERGVGRLAEQLRREIDVRRQALVQPIEASERRIAALRDCAAQANRSLQDLGYLFQGEQDRIARELAERRDRFLAVAIPQAHRSAVQRLDASSGIPRLRRHTNAMQVAAQVASETLEQWRIEEEPITQDLYRKAAGRFVEFANQFVDRLAQTHDPAFESLPQVVRAETSLQREARFYFQALEWLASPSPWDRALDLVRSGSHLRGHLEARMKSYLDELFEMTATRIQSDFAERILESRRQLESELRSHFAEIHSSAERALDRARSVRASGAAAIAAELERLASFERELDDATELISKAAAFDPRHEKSDRR